MTGSELAAIAGLTSGAITGVVARLERSGRLRREPHPHDRRKWVLLPTRYAVEEIQAVFAGLPADTDVLLQGFDADQLGAIHEYLLRVTDYVYRRAAALRGQSLAAPPLTAAPVASPDSQG